VIAPYRAGEKIYLRALEKADARTVTPWFNDLEITRNLTRWRPMSLETEEGFIAALAEAPHDLVLGICEKSSDALVGVTGLHGFAPPDLKAMFGIALGKEHQNKGYGSEATKLMVKIAFETVNAHRVWLEVYSRNHGGLRAYEKAGFVREGLLRESVYRDGEWLDVVMMGILRPR
jgi:RimJ/RimL family protein N-acetyltransferase